MDSGAMDQHFFDRLTEAREKHERTARRVRNSLLVAVVADMEADIGPLETMRVLDALADRECIKAMGRQGNGATLRP